MAATSRESGESYEYDAFISYSGDRNLAVARDLRHGIQSIGKPLWERRAARVFLDKESLAATSDGESELNAELDASMFLIVVASEETAGSTWANHEIAHFLAKPENKDRVLVAWTAGHLEWDQQLASYSNNSTACPPELRQGVHKEPFHGDLRNFNTDRPRRDRRAMHRHEFARLAAKVRSTEVDQLIGEDLRQHRRKLAFAATTALLLGVLAIAAIFAWRIAERNARAERSQALAAIAVATSADRLDRGLLLAAAAPRVSQTRGAKEGLFTTLATTAGVERYVPIHVGPVRSAAGSPDRSVLVVGSEDGQLTIWSDDFSNRRGPFTVAKGDIRDIVIRDTRSAVLAADTSGVVRVDLVTGEVIAVTALEQATRAIAVSPDGSTLIAGTSSGGLYELDAATLTVRGTVNVAFDRINALAFTADGSRLVIGGRRDSGRTKAPLLIVDWPSGTVESEGFDPSDAGRVNPTCASECVHSISSINTHPTDPNIIVVGTLGGTVVRWFVDSGPEVVGRHDHQVARVRYSPDGSVIGSTGFDGTVRYWSAATGEAIGPERTHHGASVWDLLFLDDERTATTSEDGTIGIGTVHEWVGGFGRTVLRSDSRSVSQALPLMESKECMQCFALAVDNRVVMLDGAGDVTDQAVQLDDLEDEIWAIDIHRPTHRLIMGTRGGEVLVRDLVTGATIRWETELSITSIAAHPGGRELIVGGFDFASLTNQVEVYEIESGKRRHVLAVPRPPLGPRTIMFSPDGASLVLGGFQPDHSLRRWPSLERIPMTATAEGAVYGASIAADGAVAVAHDAQSIDLILPSGELSAVLEGTGDVVWSVAFDPSGRFLASGGGDRLVRLWDIENGLRQYGPALAGHSHDVRSLAFSPDGSRLMSTSPNEAIVWNLDDSSWTERACSIAGRSITAGEWFNATGDRDIVHPCDQ